MAAATLVQTGNFSSGQVQQSAIPIALSSVPKQGDALIAVVAASASAGALAAHCYGRRAGNRGVIRARAEWRGDVRANPLWESCL